MPTRLPGWQRLAHSSAIPFHIYIAILRNVNALVTILTNTIFLASVNFRYFAFFFIGPSGSIYKFYGKWINNPLLIYFPNNDFFYEFLKYFWFKIIHQLVSVYFSFKVI